MDSDAPPAPETPAVPPLRADRRPRRLRRPQVSWLGERMDTWRRLRPWARWTAGTAAVAALAALAFALTPQPPAPVQSVSVKLSGPPQAAAPSAAAAAATAPALAPERLRALLASGPPLAPAPFDANSAVTAEGILPRTSDDGVTPLVAYAHARAVLPPAGPNGSRQLAVVVLELGLSAAPNAAAFALPGAVTLAYDATADNLPAQINAARAAGHEVALDIPAEPRDFPASDSGPRALLTGANGGDNARKLRGLLASGPGAFALLTRGGARFEADGDALWPVMQDLARRGLGWIDVTAGPGDASGTVAAKLRVPLATRRLALDTQPDEATIRAQFAAAVTAAQTDGRALVTIRSYPVALRVLAELLQTLPDLGVALVPASQLVQVQP